MSICSCASEAVHFTVGKNVQSSFWEILPNIRDYVENLTVCQLEALERLGSSCLDVVFAILIEQISFLVGSYVDMEWPIDLLCALAALISHGTLPDGQEISVQVCLKHTFLNFVGECGEHWMVIIKSLINIFGVIILHKNSFLPSLLVKLLGVAGKVPLYSALAFELGFELVQICWQIVAIRHISSRSLTDQATTNGSRIAPSETHLSVWVNLERARMDIPPDCPEYCHRLSARPSGPLIKQFRCRSSRCAGKTRNGTFSQKRRVAGQ
jgi:hypothetical protein